jgi:FtsP/CotA-like multicopper oxidase with cupredoxin domain
MSREVDRRQFLAAGGGGLILCTLGGQKVFTDREADLEALNRGVEVPPKVQEAAAASPVAAGNEATLASARADGSRKEYWIRAESTKWNAVPDGRDQMTGKKIKQKSRFTAFGYRGYTQDFGRPLTKKPTIPGPLIDCTVGDTVVVNFENATSTPVTIHPHGIRYTVEMDGAYKGKWTDPGGFVQPGESFQYVWEATEGTEGFWIYHDHGPMDPVPVYKGLFGPMIVRPAGAPRADKEFFCFFHSWQPVATGLDTVFYAVNGKAYAGNTPSFKANVGDRVAWYVAAIDSDFHTFHIHGHRWEDAAGEIRDNVTIGPGDTYALEYVEDNPGRWFYHCHVFTHLHGGMNGWYLVGG